MFVIPGAAEGSSMIFARRQARSLSEQGARIAIFHLLSRTSPIRLLREWARFRRERKQFRPHVVHAHFGTVTALFAALASGRTPVVVTYRGSDLNRVPTSDGPRASIGRLMSQLAAVGASRIVCVSQGLKDRLWWRKSRAMVLASGVDTSEFHPMPRDEARAKLGWRRSSRVILFNAGHDPRNKRLDRAEAAVAAARRALPGLELRILDGSINPAQMPLWMNASDCLLVTSDAEGSPTVVQEALATNLPIVSVDTGDVAERVAGVLRTRIAGRDAGALARALVEVLQEPGRSDGRGRAEELSLETIAQALLKIYGEVAGRRAPRIEPQGVASPQALSPRPEAALPSPEAALPSEDRWNTSSCWR
jgi:glycosyltransferase involved in cell wall biosynthesis